MSGNTEPMNQQHTFNSPKSKESNLYGSVLPLTGGVFNAMENEIWKDIKGYEGAYQVSSLGNIKALQIIKRKKWKHI